MPHVNKTIYDPLDHGSPEFRLVTVLPSPDYLSPIVCELHHYNLDQNPQYVALSYAWADYGCAKDSILLKEQAFEVTGRLDWALRRLRSRSEKRVFWIDAICINQEDKVEKSHQVARMKDIYERAQQVLIYLGDGPDVCVLVVQLLKSIATAAEYLNTLADVQDGHVYLARNLATLFPDSEAWEKLLMFFIDDWWVRAWIVQEFVVAKEAIFLFGHSAIGWDTLDQAMHLLRLIDNYNHSPTTSNAEQTINTSPAWYWSLEQSVARYPFRLIHMRKSFGRQQRLPLLRILVDNWTRKSSDPRDKVFAFLGLATDASRESLVPDYTKSTEQIYKELVKDLIMRQNDLEVLAFAALKTASSDLPSWCPDWRAVEWRANLLSMLLRLQEKSTSAGLSNPGPLVSFSEHLSVLNAKGFIIDSIEATPPPFNRSHFEDLLNGLNLPGVPLEYRHSGDSMAEFLDQSDFMIQIPGAPDQFYSPLTQTLELLDERLKTIQVINPTDPQYLLMQTISEASKGLTSSIEDENKSVIDHNPISGAPGTSMRNPLIGDFWKHAITAICTGGLTPFRTTRGSVGFAIPGAHGGDTICRLLGSTRPFILRRDGDRWKLVGQCTCKSSSTRAFSQTVTRSF